MEYSSLQDALLQQDLACHMESRSATCHLAELTFLLLPQPKLVLD